MVIMDINLNQNNNLGAGDVDDQIGHGDPLGEQCPRCDSRSTKFCYYNNYSLTQPRHYCKACRRHWTEGGVCRNVPVGGAIRRNNRGARAGRARDPLNHVVVPRAPRRRGRGANAAAVAAVAGRSVAMSGRAAVQSDHGRRRIISSKGTNLGSSGTNFPSMGTNFQNPIDARFTVFRRTMAALCPLPLLATSASAAMNASNLKLLQEFSAANKIFSNNNVSAGFRNFFLWGHDGASGSGSSNGSGSGSEPPALNDMDVANTHWTDLPDFSPPPPPSSA